MAQRGQKSKEAQDAAAVLREIVKSELPEAPDYMDAEHRAEWDAVIGCFDPQKFTRAMHALLEAYVQHTVQSRELSKLIETVDKYEETAKYMKILRALNSETKHIASLGVRLGIAVHTGAKSNDTAKPNGGSPAPWQE